MSAWIRTVWTAENRWHCDAGLFLAGITVAAGGAGYLVAWLTGAT